MEELLPKILMESQRVIKYIDYDYMKLILDELKEPATSFHISSFDSEFHWAELHYIIAYDENEFPELSDEELEAYELERREEFNRETENFHKMCSNYSRMKYELAYGIDKVTDMEMEFDGDIVITDPCYFIQDSNDWYRYGYGENLNELGFTNYMTRSTLYGDWSCTVLDRKTREELGTFCADAGLVGVYLLDEIMKYNPGYKDVKENHWSATCIRNFKGIVEFKVVHTEGIYETESSYHKKGEKWEDDSVEVYGRGINKITGKPINFVGRQIGV